MRKLLFLLVLVNTMTLAQDEIDITFTPSEDSVKTKARSARDSIRARYVKTFPDHFFVWPVIKRRTLNVEAQSLLNEDHRIALKPNNSVSIGVGCYVFEVAVEVAFAVPIQEQSTYKYGKTEASDLQLNVIGKYWGLDLYRQKYEGFYMDDSVNPLAKDEPFPQRSDIATRNFGVGGMYTFNRDKFSLRSSFTFAEQQLYSRGSWFVMGTINSFKMDGDSVILSIEEPERFSKVADFVSLRYTTFGVAPGYSHNFVYKNFFLNLTLGIGPAHNWIYLKRSSGEENYDVAINSISTLRFGIGYNADRFFGGITFVNQSRSIKMEDFRVTNSSNYFRMLIGYRFREFGFLKKRAVELIPFKI